MSWTQIIESIDFFSSSQAMATVMPIFGQYTLEIFGFIYFLIQILGIFFAINAIMHGRTTQGSIAWAISLIIFPIITIPLYIVFGARKFYGYIEARRKGNHAIAKVGQGVQEILKKYQVNEKDSEPLKELRNLAMFPALNGNKIQLLIDGQSTFNSIFETIKKAQHTILVQFYIVRSDDLGNRLKQILLEKAQEGLNIYFLFDEVGSYYLDKSYVRELRAAGVQILSFSSTLGSRRAWRFQLNFRNHRKIVVTDGEIAFVGGHNIGDEYLGITKKRGPWRDTHIRLEGPVVKAIQLSFLEDWHWASNEIPNLPWEEVSSPGGVQSLCVPSGPADQFETCELLFLSLINQAKKRIWITSPYFVPDHSLISALNLAVLRGVDVRVLLPQEFDSFLIQMASETYIEECLRYGVRLYRYRPAFLHQKVVLVDDDKTLIGTANFDNRSFHLNFEISIFSVSRKLASEVDYMLKEDFISARECTIKEYEKAPLLKRFVYRFASLFSPIL